MDLSLLKLFRYLPKSRTKWLRSQAASVFVPTVFTYFLARLLEDYYAALEQRLGVWIILFVYLVSSLVFRLCANAIEQFFVMNVYVDIKEELYTASLKATIDRETPILHVTQYISKLLQNIEQVSSVVSISFFRFVCSILLLVVYLFIISWIHFSFGILYAAIQVISFLFHIHFSFQMDRQKYAVQHSSSEFSARCQEGAEGVREIKVYQKSKEYIRRGNAACEALRQDQLHYLKTDFHHDLASNLLFYLSEALPILWGLILFARHSIHFGQVIFLIQFTQSLLMYMMDFSESYCDICSSRAMTAELLELLQTPAPVLPSDSVPGRREGTLQLDHVTIQYGEQIILNGVGFSAASGDFIALVGESGTGKTSILQTIMQFVSYEGSCRVCGLTADATNHAAIRQMISYVSQNDFFPSMSIRENLTLGIPCSEERIWQVLEEVNAKTFVQQLPEGLDTILGHDQDLSGGERQRLSIARALLRDAPVFLLDEPTSALDEANEQQIMRALSRWPEKCIIATTHHVSCLRYATKIIVLKKGILEGIGTFDELMKSCDEFKRLYCSFDQ